MENLKGPLGIVEEPLEFSMACFMENLKGPLGIPEEPLEFYTIRYRERNRKWRYQTCPTSATVVERLKPDTAYEFGVRSNKGDRTGTWSRPTIHSTSMGRNSGLVGEPGLVGQPGLVGEPGLVGQPDLVGEPGLVGQPGGSDESSVFQQPRPPPGAAQPSPPPGAAQPRPPPGAAQPSPPPGPAQPTTADRDRTTTGAATARRQETWEDSALFQPRPASAVDAVGNERFVAPHVVYQTGKRPGEPCSITSSLNYFPVDGAGVADVAAPPKSPPSNLTVVTVEGCPSFVILDWENSDQETTEYDVISTAKGPDGEQVSILTTNRTHTTVENLRPESRSRSRVLANELFVLPELKDEKVSGEKDKWKKCLSSWSTDRKQRRGGEVKKSTYEFTVKPKNQLGAGPPSGPVAFHTESGTTTQHFKIRVHTQTSCFAPPVQRLGSPAQCGVLNHFYLSNEYKINIKSSQDMDEVINNDVYSQY
ncbi:Target of Nesh-SH3 [Liparis tanakae]|uniref:Target of Nesh-SH3 n=1 Tax=Liparis tanakae TaxID=230148 RepID=A0A4Z2F9C2_9TELE|nr:Target of Nesh-SH3 [Liparis tanakae]